MVAERENERLTEEIRKYLKRKLRKVAIINTTGYILRTLISREDRIALLIPMVKTVNQRLVLNQASMNFTQALFTSPLSFVTFA